MKNYLIGFVLGIGAILPGVSSGVFCVIFGIYEKLINSILHFFDDVKKNFSFLFPIALGVFTGVFLFGNILQFVFNRFFVITSFIFIGLILGSLPLVVKQAQIKKITLPHVLCFLLAFSSTLYLITVENNFFNNNVENFSFSYLILCGILMSAGLVIPGVSKSVILILLNVYPTYLLAISTLNFSILFPLGIGLAIGSLIFLCILQFCFTFCKSYTYSAIIGFIVSSTLVLSPGFEFNVEHSAGIFLAIVSFLLVNSCVKH